MRRTRSRLERRCRCGAQLVELCYPGANAQTQLRSLCCVQSPSVARTAGCLLAEVQRVPSEAAHSRLYVHPHDDVCFTWNGRAPLARSWMCSVSTGTRSHACGDSFHVEQSEAFGRQSMLGSRSTAATIIAPTGGLRSSAYMTARTGIDEDWFRIGTGRADSEAERAASEGLNSAR